MTLHDQHHDQHDDERLEDRPAAPAVFRLGRPAWAERSIVDGSRGPSAFLVAHERLGHLTLVGVEGTPALLVRSDDVDVDPDTALLSVRPGRVEVHALGQVLGLEQAAELVADLAELLSAAGDVEATR